MIERVTAGSLSALVMAGIVGSDTGTGSMDAAENCVCRAR
jgi:hypothetical protein